MRARLSQILAWLALAVAAFGLVSIASGNHQWTAWLEAPEMSAPSAVCLAALALARIVKDRQ